MHIHFPGPHLHNHSPIRNVNEILSEQATLGQKVADKVAEVMGSWAFIITQSVILVLWILLNITAYMMHWDPYPFILMNLVLSMQAAYAAPMIMMSQNRQAARDRIEAHNDYLTDVKAEGEIRSILEHLEAQNAALLHIHEQLATLQAHAGIKNGEPEPAKM